MTTTEIRSPPPHSCERCGHPLDAGPDPLQRPVHPDEARRYTGDHQPPRPVKVSRPDPETGEVISWWCSSRCFKAAHKKSEPARKRGKPKPEQQFHINPPRAA